MDKFAHAAADGSASSSFNNDALEASVLAIPPSHAQRVIIHLDLDAFYAQVEVRRLGLDPSKPLAVQQWHGLIAVNYPARAAGLSKMSSLEVAAKTCPQLTLVHVETIDKEGHKHAQPPRCAGEYYAAITGNSAGSGGMSGSVAIAGSTTGDSNSSSSGGSSSNSSGSVGHSVVVSGIALCQHSCSPSHHALPAALK